MPALLAYRRVRLLCIAARHRGGRCASEGSENDGNERSRPLSHEREPRSVPWVPAPGAQGDSHVRRLLVALAAASLGHAHADEALLEAMAQPWTGDLDGMIERRAVRALVAPSRMQYWIDRGRQSGAEYELLKKFEEVLNTKYKSKRKHIH